MVEMVVVEMVVVVVVVRHGVKACTALRGMKTRFVFLALREIGFFCSPRLRKDVDREAKREGE